MKRKTTISKTEKEPWSVSDKINSVLAFLTLIAVIGTIWSTSIANDALALQRAQTVKSEKQDSLDGIQDSSRNARFMELTQRQIDALQEQVVALNRGVRNTEVSQRPVLDISTFGIYYNEKQVEMEGKYVVMNFGVNPAILNTVYIYTFDSKFNLVGKDTSWANTKLIGNKVFQANLALPLLYGEPMDRANFNLVKQFFVCFILKFTNEVSKIPVTSNPLMYRWLQKDKYQTLKSDEQNVLFFNLCSYNEQHILQDKLKRINQLKVKEFMY